MNILFSLSEESWSATEKICGLLAAETFDSKQLVRQIYLRDCQSLRDELGPTVLGTMLIKMFVIGTLGSNATFLETWKAPKDMIWVDEFASRLLHPKIKFGQRIILHVDQTWFLACGPLLLNELVHRYPLLKLIRDLHLDPKGFFRKELRRNSRSNAFLIAGDRDLVCKHAHLGNPSALAATRKISNFVFFFSEISARGASRRTTFIRLCTFYLVGLFLRPHTDVQHVLC